MKLDVSVVIPTFNSERTIGACLESLRHQATEIIVVDDCSSDNTQDVARSLGARVVEVRQKSAANARNVGMTQSTGDIVSFTDSDCVPDAEWVSAICAGFERAPDADIIGGSISLREDTFFRKSFATMYKVTDAKHLVDGSIMLPAMNLSVRRGVFEKLRFDENLPGALCDDVDFLYRALALGMKIRYHPEIIVTHLNPASLKDFVRQEIRHGMGDSIFRHRYPEYGGSQRRTLASWIMRIVFDMPGHVKVVIRDTGVTRMPTIGAGALNHIRHVVGGFGHLKAQNRDSS